MTERNRTLDPQWEQLGVSRESEDTGASCRVPQILHVNARTAPSADLAAPEALTTTRLRSSNGPSLKLRSNFPLLPIDAHFVVSQTKEQAYRHS